jgi:Holliday junction resolvase
MSEAKFQSKVIKDLENAGWYSIKLIKTNKNGIPDIVAIREDRTLFLEIKSKIGKTSPLQDYRIKELRDLGIEAEVLTEGESYDKYINRG